MNKRVKELWTKALRSGDFKQCRSQLSHSGGYCCLGVLEYLAFQERVIKQFDGGRPYLSPVVAEWAGLTNETGDPITNPFLGSPDDRNHTSAGWLNDNGHDFQEIADRIDQYL